MVDIAGPNRQATFAGTQSIGRGVQSPGQIGLAGLNFLANQQQQTASQQFQDQLMRQQELQSLLGQQQNRNELVSNVLPEIRQSDTPTSGMVAQRIGTNLLGMQQGDLARTLNPQAAVTNQQQNVADVQETRGSALSNAADAGVRPTLTTGTMQQMLARPQTFDPSSVGIDEGRTAEQIVASGQGGIEATIEGRTPAGQNVDLTGPASRFSEMQRMMQQSNVIRTEDPADTRNPGTGNRQGGNAQSTSQQDVETGQTPSAFEGSAADRTPGQFGNDAQSQFLRFIQEQGVQLTTAPQQMQMNRQQVIVVGVSDGNEQARVVIGPEGEVMGEVDQQGYFVPTDNSFVPTDNGQ